MLQKAGFQNCATDGCTVHMDPLNVLGREPSEQDLARLRCSEHRREERERQRRERLERVRERDGAGSAPRAHRAGYRDRERRSAVHA